MSEQKDTYQPMDGDLYIVEVKAGRFIIHRYDGQDWEQLGGGHSEQDIKTLTAPMQFLWESEGHRRYYRPTGRDAVSTDWQSRAELLEQLVDELFTIAEPGTLKNALWARYQHAGDASPRPSSEALEQLVRDCLLCIKDISDYNYQRPRVTDLLDRSAELGIIPEVQP